MQLVTRSDDLRQKLLVAELNDKQGRNSDRPKWAVEPEEGLKQQSTPLVIFSEDKQADVRCC